MTKTNGYGPRLREVREKRAMTQDELARKVSKSERQVRNFETGKSVMSTDLVRQFALALQISDTQLFLPVGSTIARRTKGH